MSMAFIGDGQVGSIVGAIGRPRSLSNFEEDRVALAQRA